MTPDTWHMTHNTWHMTHDMWHMVAGEHSLKISAPSLLQFRCTDVLKAWRKRASDLINQWVTKVFVEQPWLHPVC